MTESYFGSVWKKDQDGNDVTVWVLEDILNRLKSQNNPGGMYSYWYQVLILVRANYLGHGLQTEPDDENPLQNCFRSQFVPQVAGLIVTPTVHPSTLPIYGGRMN